MTQILSAPLKPREKPFYVNNAALYNEYVMWYKAIELAILDGKEEPQIPPFIVDAMIKITTKLSYSPNFINYSFREDMIGDAQYDCIRFAKKFKANYINKAGIPMEGNAFSYLTTIAFCAFLRRIDMEKKQSYVKAKIISETPIHEFFDSIDSDDIELQESFTQFIMENGTNLANNKPMALKRKDKKRIELLKLDEINIENFSDEIADLS